jgi:PAS domain S-box-containing protein
MLRESKARLDLALDSAEMGAWHWDIPEDKRYFDDQVCRLLGIDPATFRGSAKEFFDVVDPDDRERLHEALSRTVEHDLPYEPEYRAVWPDGTIRHIAARGRLVRDDAGRPVRINGIIWDITERKQAEEEIRESRAKLDAALASMSDAMFIADAQGRFIHFNDAFVTYHRFRDRDECSKKIEDCANYLDVYFADGTSAPPDKWAMPRALRGEAASDVEYMLRRKDTGDTWWGSYNFAPIRDNDGKIVGAVVVGREITERKRAEKELQDAHRLLADVIDGSPSPIFLKDREGRFITINAPLEKMLGMTREELKGKTDYDIASKDVADYWRSHDMEVMRAGQPLQTEEIADMKDGRHVFLASKFPLVDASGEIYGVGAISHDITDRKLQEARIVRLTRLYSMLSRVNEAIVRSRDQSQLYEEVCRIIANEGVFPLVWIGEVKDRQVAPTAFCGPAADYLKEIRIEVDGVLGQGPSGTCIREDRPVVNDDFDANPATLPWREAALRHGFRASACFPLHRHGRVIGVLTLYGAQPQDFDPEQVELLQALAADVSYALDTFEQEKVRSRAETDLQKSLKRFELLSHTADELLQSPDPLKLVNSLCREVMEHLGCHAFFNFLAVEGRGRLRLNAYAGIPEEEARKIEWLDYGVAVCGCAAQDACRIVAEHIPTTPDQRTELVKPYGIKAYACHPLLGPEGSVIGTLSFGTCDRETFSDEDLSLMKAVADQVAVAMIRMRDEEALRISRDELEGRVRERTAELQQAYDKLMRESEEREKVEGQLRQAQKLEALGTLAGGIAHDFNNMLASIIGFTELIKDHVPKESRERRHAQRILDAGIRGRELVRQMLTFSRQTEQEKKPLRLSSIVRESVKLLRASIPSTVNIKVSVKSESGVVLGDPTQISQVLMNLATNAAYAMRETGGILAIELSDFSVSPSNWNSHGIEQGLYMKLTVRDTGAGISPEIVDRIFDPFFTTKKVGEGTGLGLSVVLGIVKQSHGYITVESEPGKGSTFDVYFPKIIEEPAAEGTAGEEAVPIGKERILFVDDEEALVEMGEELLAELGYEVACRTSSREALALFKLDPSRFDLVVTDQTMPDMTGIQLAAELLSLRPEIPVILCTGFSYTANEESARAAGIKGFVMKPLTKRELARTIRKVLDE